MKLVMVEWNDSHFHLGGWVARDGLDVDLAPSVSLGVLVKENFEGVIIAPNIGVGSISQSITIPKSCIKRIRQLTTAPHS
jgi:hypothetical protein